MIIHIYNTVVICHTRNKFGLNPPRIKTPLHKGQNSDFAVNRLSEQTSLSSVIRHTP